MNAGNSEKLDICPNCGGTPALVGPFVEDGGYGVWCKDCGVECNRPRPDLAMEAWANMVRVNLERRHNMVQQLDFLEDFGDLPF